MPDVSRIVEVDYDISVEDYLRLGKYDQCDNGLTSKNFPTNQRGKATVKIKLRKFNKFIYNNEVLEEFEKAGDRAAEVREILALGAAYPDLQREFSIVSLDKILPGRVKSLFIPCLWVYDEKNFFSKIVGSNSYILLPHSRLPNRAAGFRGLEGPWIGWFGFYRFAAVSKIVL